MPAYRSSAAQAAREALAGRLRELRIEAGLTATQLAAAAGWHRTKVSRLEHADRQPSIADVRAWCSACGVSDLADDLAAAVRSIEGIYVQWQRLQGSGLTRLQERAVSLHEQTRLLRYYESQVIPGSLQTADYAGQVLRAVVDFYGAPDDVADAARTRTERQRFLRDGAHRSMFVIEESVLRAKLGGADVMAAQLGHLLEVMSLPTVSLGVIPFGVSRSGFVVESFALYDSAKVEVELVSAQVTITAPSEIKLYAKAFEELAGTGRHSRGRPIHDHLGTIGAGRLIRRHGSAQSWTADPLSSQAVLVRAGRGIAVTGHGLGGAFARWRRARVEREEPSDVEILRRRYRPEARTSPAGHATELPGAGEQGTA